MDTYTPLVSIIVPVYNCSSFLPYCLDSIRKQTYPNWECLLINDGSTDDSGKICDIAAEKDSRFRPIHKSNGGVCSARNTGLDFALGQFIMFCDQDDQMHPSSLEKALSFWQSSSGDLIMWPYTRNPEEFHLPLPDGEQIFPLNKMGSLYCSFMLPPVWNKLFETNILRQDPAIHFDETVHNGHEDLPFVYDYFFRFFTQRQTASIHMLNAPLYYWSDENNESVSKKSRHYRNYLNVELPLFTRFIQDCQNLYHPSPADLAPFYQHFIHTLAFGVVCGKTYRDMPQNFFQRSDVLDMLCWLKSHRIYSPFYLSFRLKSSWLTRIIYQAEQKSPWLYGKLYWVGFYFTGAKWIL